jgi:hypothetical protein
MKSFFAFFIFTLFGIQNAAAANLSCLRLLRGEAEEALSYVKLSDSAVHGVYQDAAVLKALLVRAAKSFPAKLEEELNAAYPKDEKPARLDLRVELERRFREAVNELQAKQKKFQIPGFDTPHFPIPHFFAAIRVQLKENPNYLTDVFNNQRRWATKMELLDDPRRYRDSTTREILDEMNNSFILEAYVKHFGFTELEVFGDWSKTSTPERGHYSYEHFFDEPK